MSRQNLLLRFLSLCLCAALPVCSGDDGGSCGVVYYFHIGKTGGSSVQQMLQRSADDYVFMYKMRKTPPLSLDGTPGKYSSESVRWMDLWGEMKGQYENALQKFRQGEKMWLAVSSHAGVPGLAFQFPELRVMRKTVEDLNCTFVLCTVFREPTSHFWSQFFYFKRDQVDFRDKQGVASTRANLYYAKQIRSLLYSTCNFNSLPFDCNGPLMAISDAVVNGTIEMLKEFDIVGQTSSLSHFIKVLGKQTGWNITVAPHSNPSYHNYSGIRADLINDMLSNAQNPDFKLYEALFGNDGSKVMVHGQLV